MTAGNPVLYVLACGGRAAIDLHRNIPAIQGQGWDVCVLATPSALKFINSAVLAEQTGHTVRYEYKQADEPDILPPPDAIAVAPATFNTINKWAQGISDTLALGILNEAVGLATPLVAVPVPNTALAKHPAFQQSIRRLQDWGIALVYDPIQYPLPTPNMGPPAAALFPWAELKRRLEDMRATLGNQPDS